MRFLNRLWQRPHRLKLRKFTVITGFILGPQSFDRFHTISHDLKPSLVNRPVILHFVLVPAGSDPELKSTARNQIQASRFLGCDNRIALSHQADPRSQTQRIRDCSGS